MDNLENYGQLIWSWSELTTSLGCQAPFTCQLFYQCTDNHQHCIQTNIIIEVQWLSSHAPCLITPPLHGPLKKSERGGKKRGSNNDLYNRCIWQTVLAWWCLDHLLQLGGPHSKVQKCAMRWLRGRRFASNVPLTSFPPLGLHPT